MKKIKLKSTLFLVTTTLLTGIFVTSVYAATNSQSVNVQYYTGGSARGHASGRDNGVYHYFQGGRKVTLNLTKASGASGTDAKLYRKSNPMSVFDVYYGQVSTYGTGNHVFSSKTNVSSGAYYLLFEGGPADRTFKISGSIHD